MTVTNRDLDRRSQVQLRVSTLSILSLFTVEFLQSTCNEVIVSGMVHGNSSCELSVITLLKYVCSRVSYHTSDGKIERSRTTREISDKEKDPGEIEDATDSPNSNQRGRSVDARQKGVNRHWASLGQRNTYHQISILDLEIPFPLPLQVPLPLNVTFPFTVPSPDLYEMARGLARGGEFVDGPL